MPLEVIEEATGRGATVIQVYGMTETTSQVTLLETADAERKAGSAGRALLGAELRIDEGEILVRGDVVAPGSAGEDGWLRTGDLGAIDSEGFLWVDGRHGDLIVTGGENVMPERVEEAIKSHPDVARRGGRRAARPRVAGGRDRGRRPEAQARRGRRGAARALRAGARGLRGSEGFVVRRRPAAHRLGQADALGPSLRYQVPHTTLTRDA